MRTFLVLLVAVGILCGWLILQRNNREREDQYWRSELKNHLKAMQMDPAATQPEVRESNMFKLLIFLHEAEVAKVEIPKLVEEYGLEAGMDDTMWGMIRDAVQTDMETAKGFGIFDEPSNLMKLERGEAPVITSGPWKGQKVAVAQIISGLLAPEAAQSLPNLVVVPAIVRDAWSEVVTTSTVDIAYNLQRNRFMSKESLERVVAARAR